MDRDREEEGTCASIQKIAPSTLLLSDPALQHEGQLAQVIKGLHIFPRGIVGRSHDVVDWKKKD